MTSFSGYYFICCKFKLFCFHLTLPGFRKQHRGYRLVNNMLQLNYKAPHLGIIDPKSEPIVTDSDITMLKPVNRS